MAAVGVGKHALVICNLRINHSFLQLASQLQERVIYTQITDDERVLAYTDGGHLFGYVQRGQELQAIKESRWQITWATAVDGNVQAVVKPI